MADGRDRSAVRCRFEDCGPDLIVRVALAVVDQVAAAVDADIGVLEALDYPLTDGIEALSDHGVTMIEVSESDGVLRVDVHVDRAPRDVEDAFGTASEAVETFFGVTFPESSVVRLAGALR